MAESPDATAQSVAKITDLDEAVCRIAVESCEGSLTKAVVALIVGGLVSRDQIRQPAGLEKEADGALYIHAVVTAAGKPTGAKRNRLLGPQLAEYLERLKTETKPGTKSVTAATRPPRETGPFPALTREPEFNLLEGQDVLPSWAGFQSRGGSYTSQDGGPSDGLVSISVTADDDGRPSPQQVAAYEYLMSNEPDVTAAVIDAIFKAYPELRQNYDAADDDEWMPPIQSPDELKNLIGLGIVHVLGAGRDGSAYIGFELGCAWDEEHGLGVLTHRNQVVDVGAAETAFQEP